MEEAMASVPLQSYLPLSEQSSRLRAFVASKGHALEERDAQNVCRATRLCEPAQGTTLARRLKGALVAHGIEISHQAALEAIAKLCGEPSWMRARQGALALASTNHGPMLFMRTLRDGETDGPSEPCESLVSAADRILETVASEWPSDVVTSQCTFNLGPKAMVLDFEHPEASWISFQLWLIESDGQSSTILELDVAHVLAFVRRVERALEYSHPGMIVLNTLRASALPHWFHFVPTVTQVGSGFARECSGDVEFLAMLDAMEVSVASGAKGSVTLSSKDGPVVIKPMWASAVDSVELESPISDDQIRHLGNRLARLRRVSGTPVMNQFSFVFTGTKAPNGFHRINQQLLEEKSQALGLDAKELAKRAGLALNAILRMRKYGFANATQIGALSNALEIVDPNELLTQEDGLAFRIETADVFLKAVEDTHIWAQLIGEGIGKDERPEVESASENLREYVELLQFSRSDFSSSSNLEPIDEQQVQGEIQALIDDLGRKGIAVLVDRGVRFAQTGSRLASIPENPFVQNTLYFEKVEKLRRAH
jgi:hypothetical protein